MAARGRFPEPIILRPEIMASTPERSLAEIADACGRLKRALGLVQCALYDLHEAFLEYHPGERSRLEREARASLERIRALSPPRSRA